jgi:hypothetical protein
MGDATYTNEQFATEVNYSLLRIQNEPRWIRDIDGKSILQDPFSPKGGRTSKSAPQLMRTESSAGLD